jgi:hypothetical protein
MVTTTEYTEYKGILSTSAVDPQQSVFRETHLFFFKNLTFYQIPKVHQHHINQKLHLS